ncbi:hypothetical protein AVEN_171679-1 [Araneus ventricosus]|uniref:Uncharacterized protein n=1 Tax=Araneus ventricosus TaxID=182803 RepID=A0A4Y2X6P8_ARAVE|nr:hypothetical protein AVEN_171679-1 [Araneus ventricosus]
MSKIDLITCGNVLSQPTRILKEYSNVMSIKTAAFPPRHARAVIGFQDFSVSDSTHPWEEEKQLWSEFWARGRSGWTRRYGDDSRKIVCMNCDPLWTLRREL